MNTTLGFLRAGIGCTALTLMVMTAGCGDTQDSSKSGATADAAVATAAADSTPASAVDGEKVYNRYCFSCHAAGIAGAPKVGVAEAWQPRAAKGNAALLASTIAGIQPGMPAMGLCNNCSEAELTAAIDHMLAQSGVQASP